MQITEKLSRKRILFFVIISLLVAVLINGNFYMIAKSAIKDSFRGGNYAKVEREIVPSQVVSDGGTQEFVISDVSDYVQMLTLSFEQPAPSSMVVQFYCSSGEGKSNLTHIGDGVVYPSETECNMEVHQFVGDIVVREVSPNSGNVKDIVQINITKAKVNSNYMSPLKFAIFAGLNYFRTQKLTILKKILETFFLILFFLFLLCVELPKQYKTRKIVIGTVVVDMILGISFAKNAIRQSAFPSYRNAIILIGILCVLAVTLTSYFLFIKKCHIHKAYILSGFLMGLVYMIALPVYQVPDEPTHLYAAYELSNWSLGIDIPDDNTIVLRQDDYNMPLQTGQFSAEDYERYYSSVFERCRNDKMVYTDREAAQTWHYQYVMGAVGITLGRLLGLGSVLTFMLGRIFVLILFVAMMSYAIKQIPIGKMAMFALALLPMTVQQSMSYSYDAVLIPAVFVTVALSIRLTCKQGEQLTKFDYVMLCVSAMACMPAKGHAYFLIGFLPLIALFNKRQRDQRKTRNIIIISLLAVLSLLATVALQDVCFPNLEAVPEGYQNYISWADSEGYTIKGLLSQPLLLLKILFRTITGYGSFYIETFLGNRLGWLELYFSDFCLRVLFFIVALACIPRKENKIEVPKNVSVLFKMVGALEILFVFAGFLLAWTPVSEGAIAGVQGRYFIPAMIVIFVALRGRFVKVSEGVDRPLCITSVIALCWAISSIVSSV